LKAFQKLLDIKMIKIIKVKYECQSCGSIVLTKREIVIDEYIKKIDYPTNPRCNCGNRTKSKFKILDISLEDINIREK